MGVFTPERRRQAPPPQPPQYEPPREPRRGLPWGLIALGIVVVALVFGISWARGVFPDLDDHASPAGALARSHRSDPQLRLRPERGRAEQDRRPFLIQRPRPAAAEHRGRGEDRRGGSAGLGPDRAGPREHASDALEPAARARLHDRERRVRRRTGPEPLGGRADEEAGGLPLVEGPFVSLDLEQELAVVDLAHLDVRTGHEPLVVVPVEKVAVVLG